MVGGIRSPRAVARLYIEFSDRRLHTDGGVKSAELNVSVFVSPDVVKCEHSYWNLASLLFANPIHKISDALINSNYRPGRWRFTCALVFFIVPSIRFPAHRL